MPTSRRSSAPAAAGSTRLAAELVDRMSVVDDAVAYTVRPLDRDATFYVAGHRGLVGSAIWRKLDSEGGRGS